MSYFALSLPPPTFEVESKAETKVETKADTSKVETANVESKATDRVFQSREDALKALKSNKNCRLKTFAKFEEALQFASDQNEAVGTQNVNR